MSATLQQLAAVSRTAFEGALPRTLRHTAASKPGLQPAQKPRQRQRRQRWWRQRLGAMAVAEDEEEEEESELDTSEGSGEQQLQEAARTDSSTGAHAWQQQQQQQQRLRRRQQGGEAPREGSGRSAGSCSGSQLSASGRPAAIEMQGGPQGFAGLTLPPVRTQPASGQGTPQHPVSVQSPQGRGEQQHAGAGSPAAAAGSPPQSARSWARGQQQPASPLSPRGSSAGAACRRRTGSGSGLTALGPGGGQMPHGQTPRPLHPGMERSQSQQSDVSVHMSIYVSQGRFKVCVLGGWVEVDVDVCWALAGWAAQLGGNYCSAVALQSRAACVHALDLCVCCFVMYRLLCCAAAGHGHWLRIAAAPAQEHQ